jgi:guanine nucleotide-binding protein G(I)/G(S)/G(T) subunit beta-1
MANAISGEEMQAKIAAARRDAEALKDKIKRKKDELADTSRESPGSLPPAEML